MQLNQDSIKKTNVATEWKTSCTFSATEHVLADTAVSKVTGTCSIFGHHRYILSQLNLCS